MQQCTGDDTVSRVLHIVALTPPNTTVVKSGVDFYFFYDPTFDKLLKYKGQKNTDQCCQLLSIESS